MGALEIHLFGDLQVWSAGRLLPPLAARVQALLAYLLLNRHAPQARQHLAFLFWPDTTEQQAHTNLRNLVYHLRKELPDADCYLEITPTTVWWRCDAPVALDVAQFEASVAAAEAAKDAVIAEAELQQAAQIYRADLLPKHFEDWLEPERLKYQQMALRVLTQLAQARLLHHDSRDGLAYAQRLLQIDPLREESYRLLMQLHAVNQDRGQALRVYHQCERVLAQELGVLPSEATQALAATLAQETAPEQSAPVQTHAALGPHSPFVGRTVEWSTLHDAWRRAKTGQPQLILVVGEPGIGKTRLAEEFLAHVARHGGMTARTRAYATAGSRFYAPLVEWLRTPALAGAWRKLDRVWLAELGRLLPELYVEHPEWPEPEPLVSGWQRQRLFEASIRALMAVNCPLLLLLDDLQWIDQETLDLLLCLHQRQEYTPLLTLATARPEALEPGHAVYGWHAWLVEHGRLAQLDLGALTYAETVGLGQALAGTTFDDATGRRLFAATEGHPLFVIESIRAGMLTEPQVATSGDGSGREAPQPPATVTAVIETRLAQVTPETRALLDVAAVIGREFSFDVLMQVCHLTESAILRRLDELWRRRLIREHGALTYDFVHDQVRDVVYAALGALQRRGLHRLVADALQRVYAGGGRAIDGELAFHYERGGSTALAIEHYRRAADAARRLFANAEAIRQYRHAIRLGEMSAVGDEPMPAHGLTPLYEGLGEVLQIAGQAEAARAAYQHALEQPEIGAVAQADNLRKQGITWAQQHRYDEARRCFAAAEAALAPLEPQAMVQKAWIEIHLERIWVCYWLNEWQLAGELAATLTPVVAQAGTPAQEITLCLVMASIAARRDRYLDSHESVEWARRGLEVAQGHGDMERLAVAYFIHGFYSLWYGNLNDAEAALTAGLELARQMDNVVLQARVLTYLTTLMRKQHRQAETARYVGETLAAAQSAQMVEYVATAHANSAWLAWCEGDDARTESEAQRALELWRQLPSGHGSCTMQWTALWPYLDVRLRRGETALALDCVQALVDETQQRLPAELEALLRAALTYADGAQEALACNALQNALEKAQQLGYL